MNKAYQKIDWENRPSTATPLSENNLDSMSNALDTIDDRVVSFDTTKANQSDLLRAFTSITYDSSTGVFVFTQENGTQLTVDLNIEKIPVSFSMDANGVITMTTSDGTTYTCDIGSLIKTYTFDDSSEIDFTTTTDASGNKTITASIKAGSIDGTKLTPNYLSDCQAAQSGAQNSALAAAGSATLAESWAVGGTGTRAGEDTNNAEYWARQAALAAGGGVISFNGRSGSVVPATGDYSDNQISRGLGTVGDALDNLEAFNTLSVAASAWQANSDSSTNTDYPYVANVSSALFTNASTPIWQMNGIGTIPTATERESIDLILEAVFTSSGVTLYATDQPTVNLILEVKGV